MVDRNTVKKAPNKFKALAAVTILFALFSPNCKSPTSPNGDGEADILIYNKLERSLDVYMDGTRQFTIQYKHTIEIDDVAYGIHELEAKELGSGQVYASTTIEVTSDTDYGWQIEDPADIQITNNYGESLSIYMDETYRFDLQHNEDRWILDVPLGEHFLKALNKNTGVQVASITIDMTEDRDYFWTIEKTE